METPKVFESEYRFCLILWEHEPIKSSDLVNLCKEQLGWKSSTTYTVINRLIEKGAVRREDPGFICRALISKRTVQNIETKALLDKVYNGSLNNFLVEYLKNQLLTPTDVMELERIISDYKM